MWYWVVMAVLVIGCIALLSGGGCGAGRSQKEKAEEPGKCRRSTAAGRETEKSRWWTAEQPGCRERAAAGCTGTSGRSTQGAGRAEKRAEKTPPVESNPGRPGFVDKVQFYFLQ